MSNIAFNPNFEMPPLDSKETVLELIRAVATSGLHGHISPRQVTATLYALQVALSVHNSELPQRPPAQIKAPEVQGVQNRRSKKK